MTALMSHRSLRCLHLVVVFGTFGRGAARAPTDDGVALGVLSRGQRSVLFHDNGGGGLGGVSGELFPQLPADLLTQVCWQGDVTIGDTVSGEITESDCDAHDVDPEGVGYYEIYRVRVESRESVTFDADSEFDNWLTLLRLVSYDPDTQEVVVQFLTENDDREDGNLNALITYSLSPGVDYFISISGYDYLEKGPYTLRIR